MFRHKRARHVLHCDSMRTLTLVHSSWWPSREALPRLPSLPLKKQVALSLLLTLILQYGCGGSSVIKSFRVALAASGPLVNSLVNAGVIPQAKATAIIADFDAGAACALTLQESFSAIPGDLSDIEKKSRKFAASLTALQCWRAIIQRQNFAVNPKVQNAANIAEGILASLVAFYSTGGEASIARTPSMVVANDEEELERLLKLRVDELKTAMKP